MVLFERTVSDFALLAFQWTLVEQYVVYQQMEESLFHQLFDARLTLRTAVQFIGTAAQEDIVTQFLMEGGLSTEYLFHLAAVEAAIDGMD